MRTKSVYRFMRALPDTTGIRVVDKFLVEIWI